MKNKLMKTILSFLLSLITVVAACGQDITGQWVGILKIQAGIQLHVVFNITKSDKGYTTTMDSPDQGAKGIPVTATTYENAKLKLEIPAAHIEYNGKLTGDSVTGIFQQGGLKLPLNLLKKQGETQVKRLQESVKPYSYYSEEVTIKNEKANITLAGTLTLPKKEGIYPVVILITGSGPQNRDEELFGHKPFLVISDYLTHNGIAVLRYDDRGTAHSTGDFKTATTLDFASDVVSAIAYLKTRKEINKKKIGLMGHSEGGVIAPIVASETKDVSFIVLLAGTGIRGDKLLLLQQELIAKAMGLPDTEIAKMIASNKKIFDIVLNTANSDSLKNKLRIAVKETIAQDQKTKNSKETIDDAVIESQVSQLTAPWMQFFIKYNPSDALTKVKCPVLAVGGEKDLQVPVKENLPAIESALKKGGNKLLTTKAFPNLNHLFQECKTGLPGEYATIEQTFSPTALEEITKWILVQVK
jgi:uncharacterized protein